MMMLFGPRHGGGHHHHHHRGGGRGGGYWRGGYGGYGPYLYPPPEVIVVTQTPACPETWAPVLATDGKIYRNACVAQQHKVGVVRAAKGGELMKQAVLGGLGRGLGRTLAGTNLGNGEMTTSKVIAGVAVALAATWAAFTVAGTARDRRWRARR